MNFQEALSYVKENKNKIDPDNTLVAIGYAPSIEDGGLVSISIAYDDSEENEDGTRDFYHVYLNLGNFTADTPEEGEDFNINVITPEYAIEDIREILERRSFPSDFLDSLNFQERAINHVEGYLGEAVVSMIFPELQNFATLGGPEEYQDFKDNAIKLMEELNSPSVVKSPRVRIR